MCVSKDTVFWSEVGLGVRAREFRVDDGRSSSDSDSDSSDSGPAGETEPTESKVTESKVVLGWPAVVLTVRALLCAIFVLFVWTTTRQYSPPRAFCVKPKEHVILSPYVLRCLVWCIGLARSRPLSLQRRLHGSRHRSAQLA